VPQFRAFDDFIRPLIMARKFHTHAEVGPALYQPSRDRQATILELCHRVERDLWLDPSGVGDWDDRGEGVVADQWTQRPPFIERPASAHRAERRFAKTGRA